MKKPTVLLLGLGFYGEFWLDALSRTDCCRIAAIAGRKDRVESLSAAYGVTGFPAYPDYREALERTEADIALIVLPTPHHIDAAKLALARGMHVLSEKPLASRREDADDMLRFKQAYPHLKYTVNQNYRWRAPNQTVKKAIRDGLVGPISKVACEFRRPEDLIGYRTALEMPLLQDVTIHHFDLLRFFTGKNGVEVYARSDRPPWSRFAGKPSTDAIMRLEDDVTVTYSGTWAGRGKPTSWDGNYVIQGERGCLTLDETGTVRWFAAGREDGAVLEPQIMPYTELECALRSLIQSIAEDTEPESSLADNYHSFSMVCAAEQSVASGLPVRIT